MAWFLRVRWSCFLLQVEEVLCHKMTWAQLQPLSTHGASYVLPSSSRRQLTVLYSATYHAISDNSAQANGSHMQVATALQMCSPSRAHCERERRYCRSRFHFQRL